MADDFQVDIDEQALISSLAQGDSRVIQKLYKENYHTVEKMVFKMNGYGDDAYDVFQDAITILYEKAKANNLNISCKLSTYLVGTAKHIWLRKLSQRKKQNFGVLYEDTEMNAVNVDADISTFLEYEKNVSKLNECFKLLGDPCNKLLKAFYLESKSIDTIANDFGYNNSESTKTQKYKCLNRLRKLFYNKTKEEQHERF